MNGDSASSLTTAPSCTTTATSSSPVGTYPSTVRAAADPDYSIGYVSGAVVDHLGHPGRDRLVGHHDLRGHAAAVSARTRASCTAQRLVADHQAHLFVVGDVIEPGGHLLDQLFGAAHPIYTIVRDGLDPGQPGAPHHHGHV